MVRPLRRGLRVVATAGAVAFIAFAGPMPSFAESTVPGSVSTGGGSLNVRLGAFTTTPIVNKLPNGTPIQIICRITGEPIDGYARNTNFWLKIGDGQYVTDAYVKRNVAVAIPGCTGNRRPNGAPAPPQLGAWVAPVPHAVGQRFRPPSNPSHDGVDIPEPRNLPIRAASGGKVITSECNTSGKSCNIDGSPSVRGCGWYVEILHPGNIITRYCHMVRRPSVVVGQQVVTGQTLGFIGTSGNSSGTHLHYEVHAGGAYAHHGNAIDPVKFMRSKNAPLGGT